MSATELSMPMSGVIHHEAGGVVTTSTTINMNTTMKLGNGKTECPSTPVTPLRQRNQQSAGGGLVVGGNSATPMSGIGVVEKGESILQIKGKTPPKPPEEFYKDVQLFHERRGTPIMHVPKISGHEVDLHRLYTEVTERGGFLKVNLRDDWDEILPLLNFRDKCVNAGAALKIIYRRCLEKYERLNYFGEDPDKMEALEAVDMSENIGRSRSRYPSMIHSSSSGGTVNAVPMSYNYRQHHVNMERRRIHRLSTDLYKTSSYEKLMLSLMSPLPNEQDFAINVCTLMTNESKQILRIFEYPKLLDVLCAHAGVFADYSLRQVFQHVYTHVRHHSLRGFWRDLLYDKLQILELYTDEQTVREAGLIEDDDENLLKQAAHMAQEQDDGLLDILNLSRGEGTQDYVGQRVHQVLNILRNLSFFDDNVKLLAQNRACMRLLVMSSNVRWGSLHNMALDIAGNIATELELLDPTLDEFSRCLIDTLCDGIEGMDRGVIINCLEILYKLCQSNGNADHIHKCLSSQFYEALCRFLPLNDIMLLIFTVETIYALSSLGARSCILLMQVRGLVDQLVALMTVEAQSYGPDGCILMRVVETVPGNMLPLVAQNIANLQNVAAIQKQHQQHQHVTPSMLPSPVQPLPMPQLQLPEETQLQLQQHHLHQQQQQQLQQPNQSQQHNQIQQQHQPTQQQPQTQQQNLQYQSQQQNQSPLQSPTQSQQQQDPPNLSQQQTPTSSQSTTQNDDEQYALAWLNATFEKANGPESHIDQQELYRMYLTHCQKCGKHSVVSQLHFPRLVRLIFQHNVGPLSARRPDGTELSGFYYVAIRLRAQPLPIQPGKIMVVNTQSPQKIVAISGSEAAGGKASALAGSSVVKTPETMRRKTIKKAKPIETTTATESDGAAAKPASVIVGDEGNTLMTATTKKLIVVDSIKDGIVAVSPPSLIVQSSLSVQQTKLEQQQQHKKIMTTSQTMDTSTSAKPHLQQQQQQPSSSLIKSLLATKVTQRQLKQKEGIITTTSVVPPTIVTTKLHNQSQHQQQPIKVASAAISQLVNNQLMQHTPVKVGQTTIKPLHPPTSSLLDKKPPAQLLEAPPPLAPLSGNNVAKDSSGRPVIIANQMLVEILDKKGDPPVHSTLVKRKLDDSAGDLIGTKRYALETVEVNQPVTPSKNAANLYAEMAASILEDEDLEDIPPLTTTTHGMMAQQQQHPDQPSQQQLSLLMPQLTGNVPRQLMFQHQSSQQSPHTLKLTQGGISGVTSSGQQMSTAMATIKTDQGLQTVPVILQQKPMEQPQIIQQMIQGTPQPQQTQYVLATNQQGQTYLVAQQPQHQVAAPPPPQPTQTVLVTQTPQQQSAGTKTIIILQQQSLPPTNVQQPQKMIMTTAQGQQVLVTQRSGPLHQQQQTQQQIFINPQTGTATHIQHVPVSTVSTPTIQRQIIQTTTHPTPAPSPQQQQQSLHQSGQISPSLLSQLNHIPATIKLHQPQPQQQTSAQQQQLARIGKSVSVVQTSTGNVITTTVGGGAPMTTTSGIQIPALQQHQSIIQQHIISGPTTSSVGGVEKRQVLIGSHRPIEIKETVITQTPTAPPQQQQQQCHLNSQTIITKQASVGSPQQQTQQMIVQHQHTHPSIIQQKISLPMTQQQGQAAHKVDFPLIQKQSKPGSQQLYQHMPQTIVNANGLLPALPTTIKKPIGQAAAVHTPASPAPTGQQQSTNQQECSLVGSSTGTVITPTGQVQQKHKQPHQDVFKDTVKQEVKPITATIPTPQQHLPHIPPSSLRTSTATTPQTQPPPAQPHSHPQQQPTKTPVPAPPVVDPNWLFVCDWRNCPRRKYKSVNDLQHHACVAHCPDHLDAGAEIFCQWGPGPGLCDGVPRKRFSLMTHIMDRHLSIESLKSAVQRRIATGANNVPPTQPPVTIVRNVTATQAVSNSSDQGAAGGLQRASTASPALSPSSSMTLGCSALQAIKRHAADFVNAKEMMDENEGPVTKSIRLTAALILRNLVTYTSTAKRSLRQYEPHLANVALSNVESSGAISHILFELHN